jgi:pilus assembly protein CpaB
MTPRQAETLVKAREEGKIQLTLRNPAEAPDSTQEVQVAEIPPAAAPRVIVKKVRVEAPRPAGNAITIIRGTNVQNTESSS